jgi:hypothetical protein
MPKSNIQPTDNRQITHTMPPTLISRLFELVSACFTGLYVETREPEEAIRDITQLARRESWRLGIWDCDSGLAFPCENAPPPKPD